MWWLAHAVFAAGFMALSYGVIRAFLTTGSFTTVYSLAELMKQIRAEKERTEGALLELQRAHKDLEVLASTDVLTGAANRREFTARATVEIARARRRGAPISFLALDLDHFKQINDRHGHQAGDEVLKAFVAIAGKALRTSDLIGRMGGEEFAVMLPDTARADAAALAERLRQVIEQASVDTGETRLHVTASLGVAQLGIDGDDFEGVLDAADTRMYQAKYAGRNKVVGE
jgi:diguanylate cyclase (GGDEF)-like protein